jgi:hypothetical protein
MSAAEKTVSALIESQLPDFINSEHPQFKRFLELYYQWMEQNSANGISNTAGNTIYHAMKIEDYRDIDQTPPEFVRYFKDELLPYFPENTALSTEKIVKAAREFYSKKGSDESIRWLFKALYDEDIEVNYPKEQILIASDGKWVQPRAFRIAVTERNKDLDVNLLERRLVVGVESGATCVVESANRNIDPTNGKEIIEIYVSNIKKLFNNGEFIEIDYIDENGSEQTFTDRIIGVISNIFVDSNIRTDPSQRRRGLLYNVGDPVIFVGGLSNSTDANDAVAIVGNVTLGSIEGVITTFKGYGYRLYSNTEVVVLRSTGDDPNANQSTDLRVQNVNTTACTANSQRNYLERINYDKTIIDYISSVSIATSNLEAFTVNNRNVVLNVTEDDADDYFLNHAVVWANGNNYSDALFTGKIATPNGNTKILGTVSYYGNTTLSGTVTVYGRTPITGLVTVNTHTTNARTVYGNGTAFLTEFSAGDFIRIDDFLLEIASVDSDTRMTLVREIPSTRTEQPAFKANLTVTGSGTQFQTELSPGDVISVNGSIRTVNTISSDTSLTVTSPYDFSTSSLLIFENVESDTATQVFGIDTAFEIELTPGQKLEIDGERRTIDTITNNYHLTVTSGYTGVLVDKFAYRIGDFAARAGFGTEYTGDLLIYDIANTGQLSTVLAGAQLNVLSTTEVAPGGIYTADKSFNFNSITTYLLPTNTNSQIAQALDFEIVETGGIDLITVINGGGGFRSEPTLDIKSYYDTHLSENYDYNNEYEDKANTRQIFTDLGLIAHVWIDNGGSGYQVNDTITFEGRGYGGNGYVQSVNATGAITSVILTDRGEGHLIRPNVIVNRASPTYNVLAGTASITAGNNIVIGTSTDFTVQLEVNDIIKVNNEVRKVTSIVSGELLTVNSDFYTTGTGNTISLQNGDEAVLTAYLFGDGSVHTIQTSAVGRVRDIRLVYRGYDYISVPNVSLKVYDAVLNPVPESSTFTETEYIYQGTTLEDATFKANVKSYNRTTNVLRMYGYSGLIDSYIPLKTANLTCSVNVSANVPVPSEYPPEIRATGISDPNRPGTFRYGNGRARARATFANGLIEFNGFYLNTDGFVSSDKVLQDSDLYHNFSYIVQSEKNLVDFETPVKNIVHPAGMSLISKTVLKSEQDQATFPETSVSIIMPGPGPDAATVTNSYSNVITGYQTIWNPPNSSVYYANSKVNVGDLFIIDDGDRIPISRIVTEVISNTSLRVDGNFIYPGTGMFRSNVVYDTLPGSVTVNPPLTGTATINAPITGTVNLNPQITGTVNVDVSNIQLTFNLVSGGANITSSSNVVNGNNTTFTTELEVGDIIRINNEVRVIESITNNDHLFVNSNFATTATDRLIYLSDGYIRTNTAIYLRGNGTTFLTNLEANDIITVNNQVRQVVNVINNTFLQVNSRFYYGGTDNICYLRSNTITGNLTTFTTNIAVNDIISVNNEIRQVVNVVNDTVMIVDSPIIDYAQDATVYKRSNVIIGSGTNFDPQVNVGDIITINNEIREVTVVTSDTEIEVNAVFTYYGSSQQVYKQNNQILGVSTFFDLNLAANDIVTVNNEVREVISIDSGTLIRVNAPFTYYGTGNDIAKLANSVAYVYNNDEMLLSYVEEQDNISFNIAAANVFKAQTGTVQIFNVNTQVIGTSTSFNTQLAANDIIMIDGDIRKVVNVSNSTVLNVNSPFTLTTSNEIIYKLATIQNTNVVSVSGNTMLLNIAIPANVSNLIYLVDPNYRKLVLVGGTVNATANVVTANTANVDTPSSFVGVIYEGNEIQVGFETRTVLNVQTNQLFVDTNFDNPGDNKYLRVFENHSFNVVTLTAY